MRYVKLFVLGLATVALVGCSTTQMARMSSSLTPSAKVVTDDFDGSTVVQQEPVNAGFGHALGFDWTSRLPESAFVTVQLFEIVNITGVQFNADGVIIDSPSPVDAATNFETGTYPTSRRRFEMPLKDFVKVATASDVRMKVSRMGEYTVTKIGPANGGLVVNTKFAPFLEKIRGTGLAKGLEVAP